MQVALAFVEAGESVHCQRGPVPVEQLAVEAGGHQTFYGVFQDGPKLGLTLPQSLFHLLAVGDVPSHVDAAH